MMSLHFSPTNEANHQRNVILTVLIPSWPGHLQILHPHSWHCSLHDMPVPAIDLQTYCELHDPPGHLFDPVEIQNLAPEADP
jgi:galactokinase